jgi:hypothetical protein
MILSVLKLAGIFGSGLCSSHFLAVVFRQHTENVEILLDKEEFLHAHFCHGICHRQHCINPQREVGQLNCS